MFTDQLSKIFGLVQFSAPNISSNIPLSDYWLALNGRFSGEEDDDRHSVNDIPRHYLYGVKPTQTYQEDSVITALLLAPKVLRKFCIQSELEIWFSRYSEDAEELVTSADDKDLGNAYGLYLGREITQNHKPIILITNDIGDSSKSIDLNTRKVFMHEIGHHIASLMIKPQQCKEFADAFIADYKDLFFRIRRHKHKQVNIREKYGHYLPTPFGDHDDWQVALNEAFAEMFAVVMIEPRSDKQGFHVEMPRTYMFMQRFCGELEHYLEHMMEGTFSKSMLDQTAPLEARP